MKKPVNYEIGHKAHLHWLHDFYKQLITQLLSGEITEEKLADKLTQIHLELEDSADRDSLIPHFYNHRGFQKTLPHALDTIFRLKISGSLLILDVDHLKKFNDTFGHLGGAKLLKIYASVIEDATRNTDLKARLGGDEFAVFLVGADMDNALYVAERIRIQVAEDVKKHFPDISWEQTVSIGLCQAKENIEAEILIQSADIALYQAKKERNKTVVFSNE